MRLGICSYADRSRSHRYYATLDDRREAWRQPPGRTIEPHAMPARELANLMAVANCKLLLQRDAKKGFATLIVSITYCSSPGRRISGIA